MTQQTFNCPACGGPNQPEAGQSRMACTYCSANLVIPEALRVKTIPREEKMPPQSQPAIGIPDVDASKVMRQAQPILTRAWNLYAYWTWLRWLFPACLVILVIGILICITLGLIPAIWISNQ